MVANNVQPTYQATLDAGRPGLMVGSDWDADTGIVETVAGIGFGLAVSQGTADKGIIIGGTRVGFRGILVRDVTLKSDDSDKYAQYESAGVITRGKVWCTVPVAVAAGDAVYFVAATGVLTNASGGNQGPINGARFASSAGINGLAIVELKGFQRSA